VCFSLDKKDYHEHELIEAFEVDSIFSGLISCIDDDGQDLEGI